MNPLDDPVELGRRIGACRGYAGIGRPELGERLGVEGRQVHRWEAGRDLGETTLDRRALIVRVLRATEAPPLFADLGAVPDEPVN